MKKDLMLILFLSIILLVSLVFALESFNSPSACSGAWTSCSNAFADDTNRATATASSSSNKSGIWNNYGFSIADSSSINSVVIRADFFASKTTGYIEVKASGDGGATYGTSHIVGGNTAEQTYSIDVTNDISWTGSKLNNSNLKINVTCFKSGSGPNPTCNLDWISVNVTYTPFDFSVSVNPSSGSVVQAQSTQTNVTATLLEGISQNVALSVDNCPAAATCSFNPGNGNPTYTSVLSISTSSSTPAGTYRINVTGTGDGKTRKATYTLNVTDSFPAASASAAPTSGTAPLAVNFTGNVIDGDAPFTYFWNFKDGTNSTQQNPQHTFSSPGNYNVTFKVTDNDGDTSTDNVWINATDSCVRNSPSVSISPTTQNGTAGSTLQYTTTVTNNDGATCSASAFNMSGDIPASWSSSFSPASLVLTPGASNSTTFSLTSDTNSSLGSHLFVNNATRSGLPQGFGIAYYNVV